MKVIRLEPYGYCTGVENAINIALETKRNNMNRTVCVLGMLVHNQDALQTLTKNGIRTIYEEGKSLEELIDLIPDNSIVILTAHGHSKEIEDKILDKQLEFVDATCPFVKQSMGVILHSATKDKDVFYIGKNGHPEALASLSISNKVHLIDFSNPIIPDISSEEPLVISQTTFSKKEVEHIVESIKQKYPKAIIRNGVCHASDLRQSAIENLDEDVQLIYVVGGKNSNNTQTLIRIAQNKFPNAKVIPIEKDLEIKRKDLEGLSSIAISSGASTPKEVTNRVYFRIELLCN